MKNDPAKIALAMIVKDDSEAEIFDNCLASIAPHVQGIYVAVTGVSGQHKKIHKIVKQYGGTSISTSPETHPEIYTKKQDGSYMFSNFAAARNVSFDMVPSGYDYITWADSDDIVANAQDLVKIATRAKELKYDVVYMVYWYAVRTNDNGEVTEIIIDQLRERLLKPGLFKWTSRLHEVCVPKESGFTPNHSFYGYEPEKGQKCVWVHTAEYADTGPMHDKMVNRNKEILEIQIDEENYKDPRTLFYLGKTCFDLGEYERAKSLLTRYRAMSGWDAERSTACEYLGLISARSGNFRECLRIYWEAISEFPLHHLNYLRLAEAYLNLNQVVFAKHWVDVVTKMEPPKAGSTIGQPLEIKIITVSLLYRIAYAEKDLKGMETWSKKRKELLGGKDDGLVDEVLTYKDLNTAVTGVFNLSVWLKKNGYKDKLAPLLNSLPEQIVNQPWIKNVYRDMVPPREWGDNEIAYYASFGGPHFEVWGPSSLEKGIGGSETAVLELSKEWAKLGYKVTVFCDCGPEEGEHDGVNFVPYYKMNWADKFNILILWRNPFVLDQDLDAKKIYMDLHDIASQIDWTEERMAKVDKVFFKSKYHRNNIPKLPEDKVVIISNGIRGTHEN